MNGMPACDRGRPVAPSEHVLSIDSALGMGDEASAPWSCVQLGRDGQERANTPRWASHAEPRSRWCDLAKGLRRRPHRAPPSVPRASVSAGHCSQSCPEPTAQSPHLRLEQAFGRQAGRAQGQSERCSAGGKGTQAGPSTSSHLPLCQLLPSSRKDPGIQLHQGFAWMGHGLVNIHMNSTH